MTAYEHLLLGRARLVVRPEHADELREILAHDTLYDWAARQHLGRPLAGRGIAYAVPLPRSRLPVVVRHNRHGGMFARLTGDRFLAATRAPYELEVSERIAAAGIDTPLIIGYATYAAGPFFRRSDVVTREVAPSRDLAAVLTSGDDAARVVALSATAHLVGALSRMGARHHDLNVKNVLLHRDREALRAILLDVDRVTFHSDPQRVAERNVARLLRSARKWRERYGARVEEAELAALADAVRAIVADASAVRSSTRR